MVTNVSKDKLQRIGSALHTPRVLRQARYTLALVESDLEVMTVLGRDFVSEVRAAVEELDASHLEHALARIASKEATREERDVMVKARRYRRAFVTRMVSARCRGAEVPSDATHNGTRAFNASMLSEDLERLIGLVLPIADSLANAGVSREFLREGEEHVRRLKEASLRQELAIRTIQRDALSRRRELTASVHLALSAILNAGKSVHVGDAAKLKQYTFAILRRPVRDRDGAVLFGESLPEAQAPCGAEEEENSVSNPARANESENSMSPSEMPRAQQLAATAHLCSEHRGAGFLGTLRGDCFPAFEPPQRRRFADSNVDARADGFARMRTGTLCSAAGSIARGSIALAPNCAISIASARCTGCEQCDSRSCAPGDSSRSACYE